MNRRSRELSVSRCQLRADPDKPQRTAVNDGNAQRITDNGPRRIK
jgi:hypothetical protein